MTNKDGENTTIINQLFYELKQVKMMQSSGKFVIRSSFPELDTWLIYFDQGDVVWATGSRHRHRRWFRALKQYVPALLTETWSLKTGEAFLRSATVGDCWELEVLNLAVQEGEITLNTVQEIVNSYIQDVFLNVVHRSEIQYQLLIQKELSHQIVRLDIEQILASVTIQSQQWQELISKHSQVLTPNFSPDLAPMIKSPDALKAKVSDAAYQGLTKLLTGNNTFWDLGVAMHKSVIAVVHSLLPLIQDGMIELKTVYDSGLPLLDRANQMIKNDQSLLNGRASSKGLIACIDDSPTIAKQLESILIPLGYEVMIILDPVQALGSLLKAKPKLIFLDLVMPNTNGYEICSFLRKSPVFKQTPIVMLTGHDGFIDRFRAKAAGSSDFLSKPPEAQKVSQVVQKFLEDQPAVPPLLKRI
jgi:chemotaxis family two-component system response regulator PixG